MRLIEISGLLFLLAILGGAAMLGWRLRRGENPPLFLAIPHGLAALAGISCLAYEVVVVGRRGAALSALLAFTGTALFGVILLIIDKVLKKRLRVQTLLVKALCALTSLFFLFLALQEP